MADKTRSGLGVDDRDVNAKARNLHRRVYETPRNDSAQTDRLGKQAQRRATAYARARGQL
ncbi:MAG: hypothetical protein ACOX12_01615 [Eggerthellaceae bacterium]